MLACGVSFADRNESKGVKIVVINGPNLGLLGRREPEVYGRATLADLEAMLRREASRLGVEIEFFQSDIEGELVRRIGAAAGAADGILLNPAAYTHTSVALRDAIAAAAVPCVEVHLSNPAAREPFRHRSLTAPACIGVIAGFGADSYRLALWALVGRRHSKKNGARAPAPARKRRGGGNP